MLGDGATWIWNLADEHFPDAVQIVDRFHAKQHLSDVSKSIYAAGSDLAQQWASERHDELDAGDIDDILDALRVHSPKDEEARKCIGYVERNRERMRYPKFRAAGLCTSTGVVEAGCKVAIRNAVQARRNALDRCLGAQLAISVHNCPLLTDSRFPMSIFKRTQRKYVKKAYRVRNWREYEAGLRNRGSLTVWISLTASKLVNWDAPRPRRRKPGRQRKYSNHAIETAVTLGMVFHLSSRQSEGLLRSLFALMKLDNDVPDHTTISRRKAKLGKVPFYQDKQKTPLHILIDSSGLAVHAGQLRRAPKSRDYRKLHLCVDEQSGEVVAGELTSKRARDSSRVASLVGQIDSPISSARADTAYDAGGVYEAIENHSAHRSPRVLIPPRKGAQLASGPASSRQRNRNIAAQARLGKRKWHTESGYSKRSKVETTFHRYKAIVGSAMRARGLAAQRVEARIGCKILNTMTALGMPDSEMIG